MAQTFKQLGQARENSTNAVSVYSPPASTTSTIRHVVVANTTTSPAKVRMFLDDDSSTYDETTTVGWDVTVEANDILQLDVFMPMSDDSGNFAYRTSVANALTISVWGEETV